MSADEHSRFLAHCCDEELMPCRTMGHLSKRKKGFLGSGSGIECHTEVSGFVRRDMEKKLALVTS